MIRYLRHDEIDFDKWDRCVDHAMNGMLYAWSWYLEMVSPAWDAIVEGDYESVMPLPTKKKWGIAYIYQPFFAQQLGVFSTRSLSSEVIGRFVHAIPRRFLYADICLNTFNALSPAPNRKVYQLRTFELDLIQDHQRLVEAYSENTRRNIKKAEKNGVFVASQGRPEDIIQAFKDNRGRDLRSFSERDYLVLKHIIYSGMHKGQVKTYVAYTRENTFCAGGVFYNSNNKVIFLFSGMTAEARGNGAMFMLIDAFIRDHAGQALILDFEGSSDENLARFYRGFGSKECVFLRLVLNRLPPMLSPLTTLYTRIRHGTTGRGIKIIEQT